MVPRKTLLHSHTVYDSQGHIVSDTVQYAICNKKIVVCSDELSETRYLKKLY